MAVSIDIPRDGFMRILAIGDIHGCTVAFDTLLAMVQPQPDDLLITLGDYVDRGPDSRGTIERLLKLRQTHRLVALRGNHDLMMVQARDDPSFAREWLSVGGRQTLASYGLPEHDRTMSLVPVTHWQFLEKMCVDWYETDTHFFVHANVYPDIPLTEQPSFMLHWDSLRGITNPRPHMSGKVMICGHTSQKTGVPLDLGHLICIDTWVYGNGWLTCLDVQTRKVWQANQRGEQREAWLDEIARSD